MPATTKLLVVGAVALAAVGVSLGGYLRAPARDAAASAGSRADTNRLGYLSPNEVRSSVALLPPPPAPGSDAMLRDEAARKAVLPLKGSPRYTLAAREANRSQANTVDAFTCALGTDISVRRTPRLYELLSRVRLDVRAASYLAKGQFKRPRPFVVHNAATCYAQDEAMERGDGSYPSARGAVGAAYALVLAELRPERANTILQRGRDFGQSRIICDQEWQSDVAAGWTIAKATVGRLDANAAYRADLETAQKEVNAELAAGVAPSRNCGPERLALASR